MSQIDDEIAAGRLWKAVDRLQGARAQSPADQRLLEQLGKVHADMGNLPAAGLAWFLTDGKDPRRDGALAAMRERHGGGESLIGALGLRRAPVGDFPPAVRERIAALQQETGSRWEPARRAVVPPSPAPWRVKLGVGAGCLTAVLILGVPWLLGLKEIL